MSYTEIMIPPNPANVSKSLLEKYNTRAPRYTSYPAAPHFSPEIDKDKLLDKWRSGNASPSKLSFYVHIPFCHKRCFFCGCFTTISKNPEIADPYLEDLKREHEVISGIIDPDREIEQLALGGGTPNFLTPDRFDKMMKDMKSIWKFSDTAECSVELDPRTITEEHLDVMLEHGFNRFSLGVQDFDEKVLEIVHRQQSIDHILFIVNKLRSSGKNAINFDLIYGLPGQTEESMKNTIKRVNDISPSRIALYSYAHVPWMKKHQTILEKHPMPDADQKLALFGLAYENLTKDGYVPVGMDHFAKKDDELVAALSQKTLHRNFMGYTTRRGLDQVAYGVSGISSVANTYSQNSKDFDNYSNTLKNGQPAIERGFILSKDDVTRRNLIIDLFCNFHLNTLQFGKRFDIDFSTYFDDELKRLEPLQDDGIVELNENSIDVTPLGRAFIRNVCMVFDKYLEQSPEQRMYSKTV